MREIKFEFLYKGLPFQSGNDDCNWFKKVYTLNQLIEKPLSKLSDVHGQSELIAKRQFTGLKDKNGVGIYEGDVVSWGHIKPYIECHPRVAVVKLYPALHFDTVNLGDHNHEFHFGSFAYARVINKALEVIGNIHQHPELITEPNHD